MADTVTKDVNASSGVWVDVNDGPCFIGCPNGRSFHWCFKAGTTAPTSNNGGAYYLHQGPKPLVVEFSGKIWARSTGEAFKIVVTDLSG